MTVRLLMPFKFKILKPVYCGRAIKYLDVGCGNHSPSVTRKWFPEWQYYGVDRDDYQIDDFDKNLMVNYFKVDLSKDSLSVIPDNCFDVIMLSHVIEHLPNGLQVVESLTEKLKGGGRIYIEFPAVRSLELPSMPGTLNFCDDSSHVRIYSVREVANSLLKRQFRILRAGTRRDKVRIVLTPWIALAKYFQTGRLSGASFWDIAGFASYVYAEKKGGAPGSQPFSDDHYHR